MHPLIDAFMARHAALFRRALIEDPAPDEGAGLYATEVIAASPQGVHAARNDADSVLAMRQAHARFRAIGTRDMQIEAMRLSPMDDRHCIAHVGWCASNARDDAAVRQIGFEAHYLMQILDDQARILGWISGDEQAVRRRHGII